MSPIERPEEWRDVEPLSDGEQENSTFAELVLSKVDPDGRLELPQVAYDSDGDCIEFIIKDESYYARRLNSMLTVYIGRESNQLVGSLIKGVNAIIKGILDQFPGFKIEVQNGKFRLEHLFTAKLWEGQDDAEGTMRVYLKQLRDVADETQAEVEGVELCEA